MSYDFLGGPSPSPTRRTNVSLGPGIIGGLLVAGAQLLLTWIQKSEGVAIPELTGGICSFLFKWVAYFVVGYVAALRQYENQRDTYEPTRGMRGAAIGAAFIVFAISWIVVIIRAFISDIYGAVLVGSICLYLAIMLDGLAASALGAGAAATAMRAHVLDQIYKD